MIGKIVAAVVLGVIITLFIILVGLSITRAPNLDQPKRQLHSQIYILESGVHIYRFITPEDKRLCYAVRNRSGSSISLSCNWN